MPNVLSLSKLSKPTQRFLVFLADQGADLTPITKPAVMKAAGVHSRIADAILRAGVRFGWWTKRRVTYSPTPKLQKFIEEIKRTGADSGCLKTTAFPKTSNSPRPQFGDLRLVPVAEKLRQRQRADSSQKSIETQLCNADHGSSESQQPRRDTAAVSRNSDVSSTRASARGSIYSLREYDTKNILDKTNTKKENPVTGSVSARSKPSAKKGAETRKANKSERRKIIAARAKAVIAKQNTAPISLVLQDQGEVAKAQAVALAYEKLLGLYKHNPTLKYLKCQVGPEQPAYGIWLRAAKLADEIGLDYVTFVKAQFYFMDQWYSRAPKPQEVASYKGEYSAQKRAETFVREIRDGGISPKKVICGRVRPKPNISQQAKFHQCEVQLKKFMQNLHATEEEVLLRFATKESARNYFDLSWLAQNETYQRLRAAGRL